MIRATHQRRMRVLLGKKPDLTLKELRAAVALECSLLAIHYALAQRIRGGDSDLRTSLDGPANDGGVGSRHWKA